MPSTNETTLRERAHRLGYRICKSRDRSIHIDDLGEYMLIDARLNAVILGHRYDASLDEIADYLN